MPSSRRTTRSDSPRSTTRRKIDAIDDCRPVGADGSRPPLLDLRLKRKLMLLALANTLPIIFFVSIFLGWVMGTVQFSIAGDRLLFTVMIILACLVTLVSCWWVLFPFSCWLRAYPLWFYRHESRLIWALPTALAWCLWVAMWLACIGLTALSVYLLVAGLGDLLSRAS